MHSKAGPFRRAVTYQESPSCDTGYNKCSQRFDAYVTRYRIVISSTGVFLFVSDQEVCFAYDVFLRLEIFLWSFQKTSIDVRCPIRSWTCVNNVCKKYLLLTAIGNRSPSKSSRSS